LKILDLSTKQPQPSIIFFLFQKNKIKSPLKGEKPEKKFQKKKKQNKKKTSEQN